MTERLLDDTEALRVHGWRSAAERVLAERQEYDVEVLAGGEQLATQVALGQLTVGELQDGLKWTGFHYWEAIGRLGQDFEEAGREDLVEATARGIAREAGILATLHVGTSSKLKSYRHSLDRQPDEIHRKYAL